MVNKTINFQVRGRVQGVAFRYRAKCKADEIAITGWIKNMHDGSVQGTATGEASNINLFKEWLEHGPKTANVSELNIEDVEKQVFDEFIIR